MALPYKIATMLYCFGPEDQVLLLERAQEPNRGLWSPCGGKLKTDLGESPYACACREAREELALDLTAGELHLTGLVSEHGYQGQTHWLMFLFEVRRRIAALPRPIDEGRFQFFPHNALAALAIPQTDRERIWPLFWEHRGGFFAAHCHCHPDGTATWTVEESNPPRSLARTNGRARTRFSSVTRMPDEPVIDLQSDHHFMGEALRQATRAYEAGEVPVGAVVVCEGRVIARAHNQVETLTDATAHAEMLAITQAEAALGDWRLNPCALYVTKEPCPMCAGALVLARMGRVVFGVADPKAGSAGSALNLLQMPALNHRCQITPAVREEECRSLLLQFFAEQRARNKTNGTGAGPGPDPGAD